MLSENFQPGENVGEVLLGYLSSYSGPQTGHRYANWKVGTSVTERQNVALQPSKSGGSGGLSVTPVDIATGQVSARVSRTAAVSELDYIRTDGRNLALALKRCVAVVDRKTKGQPRAGAYYYITYEVVLDDGGDPGGPMRPPASGSATGVVFASVLDGERAEAAA